MEKKRTGEEFSVQRIESVLVVIRRTYAIFLIGRSWHMSIQEIAISPTGHNSDPKQFLSFFAEKSLKSKLHGSSENLRQNMAIYR